MAETHREGRLGFEDTLNFTNTLCVAYTLCSTILRGWIRRGIYGIDDLVVAAATFSTLGFFAANYVALEHGAGKPWHYIEAAHDVASFNRASIASVLTFTISLYLSKSSVVAFLLRLTKDSRQIWLYRICLACMAIIALTSVLLLTCGWPHEPEHYWASSSSGSSGCSVQSSRWKIWTVLDVLTELLLLILPVHMTWSLQMPTNKKLAVLGAFYLRLPIIGISIGRLIYTQRLCRTGGDLGLDSSLVLIWAIIEASYALLTSHFLALRALTLSFNSGFGFGFTLNAGPESYSMHQSSRAGLRSGRNGGSQLSTHDKSIVPRAAHGSDDYHTSIRESTPSARENSASGSERIGLSIMRETEYTVHYQDVTDEAPILSRS